MVVLPRNVPCLSLHPLSYSLTAMSVTARVALFCSAMVSNGRKGFTEYGISVGNALSYGVNWHFHQCVRGERGDLKISRTFSVSPNLKKQGQQLSLPSQLYLMAMCTKILSCLCTRERAAAIGMVSGGTWSLLLGSASLLQQSRGCC